VTGSGENYTTRGLLICIPHQYYSVIKWRRMRMRGGGGHVARMGERRGLYRVLVGNPEGK
jgi:hypothetical protein